MKVAQLARFLDSVMHGLDGVVSTAADKELVTFAEALQPFSAASVGEFTNFLKQFGTEFQRTGTISAQGKISAAKAPKAQKQDDPGVVARAVASVRGLFAEIDQGTVNDHRVEQVLQPMTALKVPQLQEVLAGLQIAERPRAKPKIMEKIRQVIRHQIESRERANPAGGRSHGPSGTG